MNHRYAILAALALLWSAAALPAPAPPPWSPAGKGKSPAPQETPRRNITYINGIPDTSSYFLKDTVVLARVNDRALRVREYIQTYYDSYPDDRPSSDSLGRAEWLNSMINKEVVGAVARR